METLTKRQKQMLQKLLYLQQDFKQLNIYDGKVLVSYKEFAMIVEGDGVLYTRKDKRLQAINN